MAVAAHPWGVGGDVYSHSRYSSGAVSRRWQLPRAGSLPLGAGSAPPASGATFAPGAAFWVCFHVLVLLCVCVDMLLVGRRTAALGQPPAAWQAAVWSAVCVALSLCLAAYIWSAAGAQAAAEFLTGYLVELTLSCDNVFVIMLIFKSFKVRAALQRRVLNVGVGSAMVLRGAFVFAGGALVERFSWLLDIFGLLLLYAAVKLMTDGEDEDEDTPAAATAVRLLKRVLPVTERFSKDDAFFLRDPKSGRLVGTPLLVSLVAVEACDVVFALDSIPAIFSLTTCTSIVYVSNICAILGLRSLYLLLSAALTQFRYLKYGLAAILGFVAAKILLAHWLAVPVGASLAIIAAILAATFAAGGGRREQVLPSAR